MGSKFKRAKKKLITKARAGAVFGGGGLAAFGLGGIDNNSEDREVRESKEKKDGKPLSSSVLPGALMAPVEDPVGGKLTGDRDVNFAWPGRDRDAPEAEDDLDFSDEN